MISVSIQKSACECISNSISFDGINDSIEANGDAASLFSGDHTITFWLRMPDVIPGPTGTFLELFYWGDPILGNDALIYYTVQTGGLTIGLRYRNGGTRIQLANEVYPATAIPFGQWCFYVLRIKGDLTQPDPLTLKQNNVDTLADPIGINNAIPIPSSNTERGFQLAQIAPRFNCRLAEFAIWNGLLTDSQVDKLYRDGSGCRVKSGQYGSIRLYYPLNEVSGAVANDPADPARNGAFINGVTLNRFGPCHQGCETSCVSSAVQFDGINDYVTVATPALDLNGVINDAGRTFLFWVYFDSLVGTNYLYAALSGASDFFVIEVSESGSPGVFYLSAQMSDNLGLNRLSINTSGLAAITPGVWWNLALVLDNVNAADSELYVNGVNQTSSVGSDPSAVLSTTDAFKGIQQFGKWAGRMAEFTVFNRKLSASEVLAKYNGGIGCYPTPDQLLGSVLHYRFDEVGSGTGTPVVDYSPLGINGIYQDGVTLSQAGPCV